MVEPRQEPKQPSRSPSYESTPELVTTIRYDVSFKKTEFEILMENWETDCSNQLVGLNANLEHAHQHNESERTSCELQIQQAFARTTKATRQVFQKYIAVTEHLKHKRSKIHELVVKIGVMQRESARLLSERDGFKSRMIRAEKDLRQKEQAVNTHSSRIDTLQRTLEDEKSKLGLQQNEVKELKDKSVLDKEAATKRENDMKAEKAKLEQQLQRMTDQKNEADAQIRTQKSDIKLNLERLKTKEETIQRSTMDSKKFELLLNQEKKARESARLKSLKRENDLKAQKAKRENDLNAQKAKLENDLKAQKSAMSQQDAKLVDRQKKVAALEAKLAEKKEQIKKMADEQGIMKKGSKQQGAAKDKMAQENKTLQDKITAVNVQLKLVVQTRDKLLIDVDGEKKKIVDLKETIEELTEDQTKLQNELKTKRKVFDCIPYQFPASQGGCSWEQFWTWWIDHNLDVESKNKEANLRDAWRVFRRLDESSNGRLSEMDCDQFSYDYTEDPAGSGIFKRPLNKHGEQELWREAVERIKNEESPVINSNEASDLIQAMDVQKDLHITKKEFCNYVTKKQPNWQLKKIERLYKTITGHGKLRLRRLLDFVKSKKRTKEHKMIEEIVYTFLSDRELIEARIKTHEEAKRTAHPCAGRRARR